MTDDKLQADKKMIGWIIIAALGMVIVAIQALMPDLVPDVLNGLISQNSQYVGVEPFLKATLLLWMIGGYALFLGGIVGTIISYNRHSYNRHS